MAAFWLGKLSAQLKYGLLKVDSILIRNIRTGRVHTSLTQSRFEMMLRRTSGHSSFNWVRKSGNRCSIVLRKNKENRDKVMEVYMYPLTYNVHPSPNLTKHKITHMYKPLGDKNKHLSEVSWLLKRTIVD